MLSIDLKGKRAFVAGVADDDGYGWAIAKALHQAGATVCVGTWPPVLTLFTKGLERKKFADSATYPGGEKSIRSTRSTTFRKTCRRRFATINATRN